ncbi:MAG: hypothetical protein HOO96_27065 [Polyangiaceae bacterium]|nr:hypothetical protein [Polyangiaceae bacterium]
MVARAALFASLFLALGCGGAIAGGSDGTPDAPDGGGASSSGSTSSGGSSGSTSSGGSSGSTSSGGASGVVPPPTLACYVPGSSYEGAPAPVAAQGSAAQRTQFFEACFGPSASFDACSTVSSTNYGCAQCLLFGGATLPPSALITRSNTIGTAVVPNLEACQALAVGAPGDCARRFADAALCAATSCATCAEADLAACAALADSRGCGTPRPSASCAAAIADDRATADATCGSPGATFDEIYSKIAAYFCGP